MPRGSKTRAVSADRWSALFLSQSRVGEGCGYQCWGGWSRADVMALLPAGFEGPQQACSSSRSRASIARQAADREFSSFHSTYEQIQELNHFKLCSCPLIPDLCQRYTVRGFAGYAIISQSKNWHFFSYQEQCHFYRGVTLLISSKWSHWATSVSYW